MKKKRIIKVFKTIWMGLGVIFMVWNVITFQARGLPDHTFQDDDRVEVLEETDQFIFQAKNSENKPEIIFFQGGLADPEAYAPLCRNLAAAGYTCHLIKMAWRLPQNDYQKIQELFDLNSGKYIIGGHSQGAKIAAQFVFENPELMRGLFLLGTSHPRDIDLSFRTIPTLKIYAQHDGLASMGEVLENKAKLPQGSQMVLIEGGNHSQFGYLGKLFMDGSAEISVEEQQEQTVDKLLAFLNDLIVKP